MLEQINKYRSAPERKHLVLGVKAFAGINSHNDPNPVLKKVLTEHKAIKAGLMTCRKELDLLLCDVIMVAAFIGACVIIKCKLSSLRIAAAKEENQ